MNTPNIPIPPEVAAVARKMTSAIETLLAELIPPPPAPKDPLELQKLAAAAKVMTTMADYMTGSVLAMTQVPREVAGLAISMVAAQSHDRMLRGFDEVAAYVASHRATDMLREVVRRHAAQRGAGG